MPQLGFHLNPQTASLDHSAFSFAVSHQLDIRHHRAGTDKLPDYDGQLIAHCRISGINPVTGLTRDNYEAYLNHVLPTYGHRVARWILLNEYFDDGGNIRHPFRGLGSDFPQWLFSTAKQILPSGRFLISDYQLEKRPKKQIKTVALMNSLGGNCYGLGLQLQAHTLPYPEIPALVDLVRSVQALGYSCDFTEVTCWNAPLSAGGLQGRIYGDWLNVAIARDIQYMCFWAPWDIAPWYPRQTPLTQWGLLPQDRAALLARVSPGLWDRQGRLKGFGAELLGVGQNKTAPVG